MDLLCRRDNACYRQPTCQVEGRQARTLGLPGKVSTQRTGLVVRKITKLSVLAAAILLGNSMFAAPVQATPQRTEAQVQAIVDSAFNGTLTASDKSILINEYPEIAAVVPDQTSVTQTITSRPTTSGSVTLAATKCSTYSGYNTLKSLLGFTIYRFSHKATVCSNGTKVTSHNSPTYTISLADTTVDHWSVVDRSVTGVGTSKSTSRIQVKVVQCVVKYGCYANHYPTGTIKANRNNTAAISTTAR